MMPRPGIHAITVGLVLSMFTCAWAQDQTPAIPRPRPPSTSPAATQPTTAPGPRIEVSPREFNFGEVWQTMPVTREFTIRNIGDAPLTVAVGAQCGCTPTSQPKSPVAPGDTTTFTIGYDTKRPAVGVQKTVHVHTNDPLQPSVEIKVSGTVKALFAATPRDQIYFADLDVGSRETQKITLENKFDRPLKLKLKEGQDLGSFEVELREIREGAEYELIATTKPPLKLGFNRAEVVLETGFDKVPAITYLVAGNAQPRVMVTTPTLLVPQTATQPTEQYVRLQFRIDSPIKITAVKSTPDSIKCEIMPVAQPMTGQRVTFQMVKVKLPGFDDLPDEGAKLEIYTDDQDPNYQKFEVPIVKRAWPHTQPVTVTPAEATPLAPEKKPGGH